MNAYQTCGKCSGRNTRRVWYVRQPENTCLTTRAWYTPWIRDRSRTLVATLKVWNQLRRWFLLEANLNNACWYRWCRSVKALRHSEKLSRRINIGLFNSSSKASNPWRRFRVVCACWLRVICTHLDFWISNRLNCASSSSNGDWSTLGVC